MPNHVHLLLQPFADHSLQKVLSSMRRVSARNLKRLPAHAYTWWQAEL